MAERKNPKTDKALSYLSSEPIRKLYNKNAPLLLFEAMLFVFAAALIFMRPLQTLAIITVLFGAVLSLFGLYQLFLVLFSNEKEPAGRALNSIFGVVNIILGLIFFLQPVESMMMVVYIFAILFLIKAIRTFMLAMQMSGAKAGHYVMDIIISVALAGLAIFVLFFPKFGALTAMYFIAATLLLYAIADVHMYMELSKLKKKLPY